MALIELTMEFIKQSCVVCGKDYLETDMEHGGRCFECMGG